jgi:hypothetical protein
LRQLDGGLPTQRSFEPASSFDLVFADQKRDLPVHSDEAAGYRQYPLESLNGAKRHDVSVEMNLLGPGADDFHVS